MLSQQPPPGINWFETPVFSVGGWLVVLLCIGWLLVTDRLMPTSRHDKQMAKADKQIEDWKATALANGARADLAVAGMDKLVEEVKTSNALLRSFRGVSERNVP